MTYTLVELNGDSWCVTSNPTRDGFIDTMRLRGFEKIGVHLSKSTRAELQGEPKFDGAYGPMWDGDGKIRYETPEAYGRLSA